MAPLDTGRYFITNHRHKNAAILRNANNHSGLIARNCVNDASEMWNIDRLGDGTYKIRSHCHNSFANTKTSAKASRGDVIVGGSRPRQWKIVEMSSKGVYCIFPTDSMDVCWSLANGELNSPIVLGYLPNVSKNQWSFTRIEEGYGAAARKQPASASMQPSSVPSTHVQDQSKSKPMKRRTKETERRTQIDARPKRLDDEAKERIKEQERRRAHEAGKNPQDHRTVDERLAEEDSMVKLEVALARLVSTSESDIGLDSIVKGAEESLKFIEPWSLASSEHPTVIIVIQGVQTHGLVYCQAVDKSIKTAENGCAFSNEAVDMCGYLLNKDTPRKELVEYIQGMRETAISAHNAATEASKAFRSVRAGLFELAKLIPGEVAKLTEAEATAKAATMATAQQGNFITRLFMPRPRDVTTSQVITSNERPSVPHDSGAAIAQLREAMAGLLTLTKSVDAFADWWLTVDTALAMLETSTASLKPGCRVPRLKVDHIRKRWEKVGDDYQNYKLKITRLRDIYQFQLTEA